MARSDPLVPTSPKQSPIETNKIDKEDDTGEELTDRSETDDWEMVESSANQEFKRDKFSPSEELVIPQSLPEPECTHELQDVYENEEIIIQQTFSEDSRDKANDDSRDTRYDGCTIQRHVVEKQHVEDDDNSDNRGTVVGMGSDEDITEFAPQVSIPFDDRVDTVRTTEESSETLSDGTWVSKTVTHIYVSPREDLIGSDMNITAEIPDELSCDQTSDDVTIAGEEMWRNHQQQQQHQQTCLQSESDILHYERDVYQRNVDETRDAFDDEHLITCVDVRRRITQETSSEDYSASKQTEYGENDAAQVPAVDESFNDLKDKFREEQTAAIEEKGTSDENAEIENSDDNEILATANDDDVASFKDDYTAEDVEKRQNDEFAEMTLEKVEEVELSRDADTDSAEENVEAEETDHHSQGERSMDDVENFNVEKDGELVDESDAVVEPASEMRSVYAEVERKSLVNETFSDEEETAADLHKHETFRDRLVDTEADDLRKVVLEGLTPHAEEYLVTNTRILEEELIQQGTLHQCEKLFASHVYI
jgi:hypothetical protein